MTIDDFLKDRTIEERRMLRDFLSLMLDSLDAIDDDVTSVDAAEVVRERAKPFRFSMVGIPVGSKLEFDDPREGHDDVLATVTTVDDANHVSCNGRVVSLSQAAKQLGNCNSSARGALYFLYRGERLTDMRARIEGATTHA